MLVMLDLDNTLSDRQRAVADWAAEFVAEQGQGTDAVDWLLRLDNDGHSDRAEVFRSIQRRFGTEATAEELERRYRRRVIELTRPTPGAIDCLVELRRQGHTLAIVTNGGSSPQQAKIDALGLRRLVDGVCVSAELGVDKPDARIFEAAAAATGSSLVDAWMVGDTPRPDIYGAGALGIRSAWMRRGRTWNHVDYAPTVALDRLDELPAVIAGM